MDSLNGVEEGPPLDPGKYFKEAATKFMKCCILLLFHSLDVSPIREYIFIIRITTVFTYSIILTATCICFAGHVEGTASAVWGDGQGHPEEGEVSAQQGCKILYNKYPL